MIINNNYTQMTKKRQGMGEGFSLRIVLKEATSLSLRGLPAGARGNLALKTKICHCEPARKAVGRGNLF
jgi:hypothetical protein